MTKILNTLHGCNAAIFNEVQHAPLALFDLDHTLLDGDGDDLWCRFMIRQGMVDADVAVENQKVCRDYREGRIGPEEFSSFYARLFAGQTQAFLAPWQNRFLIEEIRPRLPPAAYQLVASHRAAGHTLVLTTASNRIIAERTAAELGFEHLLATELEQQDGRFTGRFIGVPNMCEGKLLRLRAWLAEREWPEALLRQAWFYSDSINDLPLLCAVGVSVVVNPDARLRAHATAQGWPCFDTLPAQRTLWGEKQAFLSKL